MRFHASSRRDASLSSFQFHWWKGEAMPSPAMRSAAIALRLPMREIAALAKLITSSGVGVSNARRSNAITSPTKLTSVTSALR